MRRLASSSSLRAASLSGSSESAWAANVAAVSPWSFASATLREAHQRACVRLLLADGHPLATGRAQETSAQIHLGQQLAALTLSHRHAVQERQQRLEVLEVLNA